MKAVVFKGPKKVVLEDRPIPKIQDPTDIIVKVEYTALCGSYVSPFLPFLFNQCLDQLLTPPVNSTSTAATNPQEQTS